MTIASEITRINNNIASAYTAVNNKGGTLPATQNSANLATAIGSISTGGTIDSLTITPTTSQQTITASGGVDGYSPITVNAVTSSIDNNITAGNIKSGVSILGVTGTMQSGYTEFPNYQVVNGVANRRSGALTGNEFSGITSIGNYGLYYSFYRCSDLSGTVSFPSLISIGSYGLYQTFNFCTNLTSASFPELTSIGNFGCVYAFYGCNITNFDFSLLSSVGASGFSNTFNNCQNLASISFPSLTDISSSAIFNNSFLSCYRLTNIYFNALTTSSFGSTSTNQFNGMFDSSTGIISSSFTMHFPSNLETTIQGLTGYPRFGSQTGRLTLAFDLPATS